MALPSEPTFKKRLSPPAQLAAAQPLRNSKVSQFYEIRRFAGVFDGSFSVSRILRLFEGLFCEKIEKKRPQEANCRYKMVKNSRKPSVF